MSFDRYFEVATDVRTLSIFGYPLFLLVDGGDDDVVVDEITVGLETSDVRVFCEVILKLASMVGLTGFVDVGGVSFLFLPFVSKLPSVEDWCKGV